MPGETRIEGDVPVVSSSGITGFHNEAKAQAPGVVTGRYGTIGEVYYLDQDYWPLNTSLYVIDFKGTRPRFAAYFLRNVLKDYQSDKAAVPGVDRNVLHEIKVRAPDPTTQERIEATLTAYDDMMENNRRRMALLEESARLLYREWFVHLRFPGHEHTCLINGLPQGWERVELNNIINVTHGYAFQGADFSEETTSRVLTTPGNFRIGGGIKLGKPKFYSEAGPLPPDYILAPMDLIVTMTDLSKDSDTLGYPAFVAKLPDVTFLHNQRVGKVVPRGDFFPKHFLYCVLCDERYRHHVVGAATGGVIKHTSPKRILSYEAGLPRKRQLIEDFESFAAPLFAQINILVESNEKLRAARDMLLPRLMNGEIEV
ncbi:type I restriction-modification system subunit S [Brevifollis gellanilyticus]|uniref:Type I restriction-modification system subunit S n=1 Tax=Brevifollis gellanilyticus TaxID=748831 RepID=A0A512MGN3_9BACT|nr:type I restriction-modification system subunit S [Brevifollis gellanilyticus]